MRGRERLLERLATLVSDGANVDWQREEASTFDESELVLVRDFRVIEEVARAHKGVPADLSSTAPTVGTSEAARAGAASPAPEARQPIGTWGHLEILESIAGGGFGEVYRGWDPRIEREVALKLLRGGERQTDPVATGIIEEGRLLARVRHPNVVTVFGAECNADRVGIWMEMIRGRTLQDLLRDHGPLGAREASVIGQDLCRALAAIHLAGLIHRDVKARNVMREEGGRIVLMDLGAAIELPSGTDAIRGEISGTPLYMAPEVLRGEQATPVSDIYSLGVLLYYLVTGAYPVEARSVGELREAHATGRHRRLRDARPDLPSDFIHAVESALDPDPSQRPVSAGSMEAALAGMQPMAHQPMPGAGQPAGAVLQWIPHVVRGSRARMAALASVLLVVSLVVVLPRWRSQQPPVTQPPASELIRPSLPEPTRSQLAAGTPEGSDAPPPPKSQAPPIAKPTPLNVEANLFRVLAESVLNEPLLTGQRIHPGDQLYLEVEAAELIYVYVVNMDAAGRAYVLFPLQGMELKNPLAPNTVHRLPGKVTEVSRHANWEVSSSGGKESFLVFASRGPYKELEELTERMKMARLDSPAEVPAPLSAKLRGIGTLKIKEPAEEAESSPRLRASLENLTGGRTRRDVWIREIILENP